MVFVEAVTLLTGIWVGVTGYRLYLRRLHKMSGYIRMVQQGVKRKAAKR
jgi:hypothetical protein